MYSYKSNKEIEDSNIPELLAYHKELRRITRELRINISDLSRAISITKVELQARAKFLPQELAKLEQKRINAMTVEELAALDIN